MDLRKRMIADRTPDYPVMKPESSYQEAYELLKKDVASHKAAIHRAYHSLECQAKRSEQFRKALNLIAYSSGCIYPSESPSQYEVGKAHGHRCAAKIAKDALNED